MDMRVVEAGEDAAAAQIDDVGRRKCRLVHADAAGDPLAGERERTRNRHRRLERADDAVFEDHGATTVTGIVSSLADPSGLTARTVSWCDPGVSRVVSHSAPLPPKTNGSQVDVQRSLPSISH